MINDQGCPHWYSTLFITTQSRNSSRAPNTSTAMLAAIRQLYTWSDIQKIDLEGRFASGLFLRESEIESLRAFTQARRGTALDKASPIEARVGRRKEDVRATFQNAETRVKSGTQYIRMTYISSYLQWLANRITDEVAGHIHPDVSKRIESATKSLRIRRPNMPPASRVSARSGLTEQAQAILMAMVTPSSTINPFEAETQNRNQLIISLLLNLGIRAGELLAMKVSDLDLQRNEVVIPRRHGDPTDPRKHQPVAKTLDRRLALSNLLVDQLLAYITGDRKSLAKARKHSFLIVTHQKGPFQGMPLSQKGLTKIFTKLQV
ncbi:MAG TPA: site-specific integrase, partial [Acidobacteriaceae bacterium]|nr:site-specific integrase [Acidobacteriaceae bacterium]